MPSPSYLTMPWKSLLLPKEVAQNWFNIFLSMNNELVIK